MAGLVCFFMGSNVWVMVVCFIVGGRNHALGLEGLGSLSGCLMLVVLTRSEMSCAPPPKMLVKYWALPQTHPSQEYLEGRYQVQVLYCRHEP